MGQPINVFWDFLENLKNLVVSVKIGSAKATPHGEVLAQLSENTFEVADDNGNIGICMLVEKTADELNENEMSIKAFCLRICSFVFIKKIINDIMIDFKNIDYKWSLENDSTENIILLRTT